jgi:uroporphyrinogen-III synthase
MDHGLSAETALYAIGPVTAEKVRSMTGRVPRTPGEYTVEALADLIASDRKN